MEGLEHVIVIGASNREDMIDPAILRPGRLDVKIKIERPDAEAARDIFGKYLIESLPLHPDDVAQNGGSEQATVQAMIDAVVLRMYTEEEENRFLEVTYAGGDKEILYFKDFNSGAMIQNIVDRAKKMAIKDYLDTGQRGLRVEHLLQSCTDEFRENEDLPNTTNPDDWARISGKKGDGSSTSAPSSRPRRGPSRGSRSTPSPIPVSTSEAPHPEVGGGWLMKPVCRSPGSPGPVLRPPPAPRGVPSPATPTSVVSPRCG